MYTRNKQNNSVLLIVRRIGQMIPISFFFFLSDKLHLSRMLRLIITVSSIDSLCHNLRRKIV